MHACMPAFNRLLDSSRPEKIDEMCRKFFGFFHFAEILEDLARGIHPGRLRSRTMCPEANPALH